MRVGGLVGCVLVWVRLRLRLVDRGWDWGVGRALIEVVIATKYGRLTQTPTHNAQHHINTTKQTKQLHALPHAQARHPLAALGLQHRPRRRRDALLRPERHRQDDALDRAAPPAHRRRRALLGRRRRLQHRGRLLRQVHRAAGQLGAGDLPRDPVRSGGVQWWW